jgi:hypothetical protein
MLHTLPYFENLFFISIPDCIDIHNVELAAFYAAMYMSFLGFICMLEGTTILVQVLCRGRAQNREI